MNKHQYESMVATLDEVIRAADQAKIQLSTMYHHPRGLLGPGDVVVNKPVALGGNMGMPQGVPHTIKEVVDTEWHNEARGVHYMGYYNFESEGHEGEFWSSAWDGQVVRYEPEDDHG